MGETTDEVRYNNLPDDSTFEQDANVEETDETAAIRSNIDQTRAEMSETIEAIQERLSPQTLKEQVKDQVREQFEEAKTVVRDATIGKAEEMVRNAGETVNEARYTVIETIRQNPIPAALVGIGLGWLFMNGRNTSTRYDRNHSNAYYRGQYRGQYYQGQPSYTTRSYTTRPSSYDYDEPGVMERGQRAVGDTVQRAQEKASDVASRVQDTVGNLADRGQATVGNIVNQAQETTGQIVNQAQETANNLADQAQYQAQRLEDRFQQALIENPLAVGAIAFAVGAAVGLAVPQTQREHELMGEARDNLIERAQEVAQDTVEKVQQVTGQVVDQAQTTLKEQAQEQGLTSG
jgi:ElaB/YqjD/DUF883 family membrane-anchored ribosome-binding protein